VLEVPLSLASTRTTHFDKVSHRLHTAIVDVAPCYDHVVCDTNPRGRLLSALSVLNIRRASGPEIFSSIPLLAHSSTPVTIFQCDTEPEDTAYYWQHFSYMGGIGKLSLNINSQHLMLGQHSNVTLDLTALSPATTIHTVSVFLVQTTTAASTIPSAVSRSSTNVAYGGRIEMIDSFQIYSHGMSWAKMAGRARPTRRSYVWRGQEASLYTKEVLGGSDLPLDRAHGDGFGLSSYLTMPSPIIGAHPSTARVDLNLATIAHILVFRFDYSILGEDAQGQPLPTDDEGLPVEGSVRSWSLEKEIHIHSDLLLAVATAAPLYPVSKQSNSPFQSSTSMPSSRVPRSVSLGVTRGTMMRQVYTKEKELVVAARRHWDETAGVCACFHDLPGCDWVDEGRVVDKVL
jgi:hypothetical protein